MTSIPTKLIKENPRLFLQDSLLIFIMVVLAACGLIYQYLLSHYAGRVLGVMEHAIYTMIGIMIVSMGLGSFAAKYIKSPYTGFAWIEAVIAFLGATGILLIGGAFAIAILFPEVIANNFSMPSDLVPTGSFTGILDEFASITPFIIGFLIGFLIGMEIPFIARIRERLYGKYLEHNVGTIYGADYIGAGIGAAIFIIYMLTLPPQQAAIYTATANLIAGFIFLIWFFKDIKLAPLLFIIHLGIAVIITALYTYGSDWNKTLENVLYEDQVVFSTNTDFQHLTLTKRKTLPNHPPIYTMFLNGRTQFRSDDEKIYHDMLVHPPMLASSRHNNILLIGGGDGLAARDILKWNPDKITMLELDKKVVETFQTNEYLTDINKNSLNDPKMNIIFDDAFNSVDKLLATGEIFDVIIVDLPDPSHPDLNKLYSVSFYKKLHDLINGDGAISIQSTSPYHAKKAFITVGITLKAAGFNHVQRYHQNVPSFGQWGWTIATKYGQSPKNRVQHSTRNLPKNSWATKKLILSSFEFSNNYFEGENAMKPNTLGNHLIYQLHQQAWMNDLGINNQ